MGLLYLFPTDKSDNERIEIQKGSITLKTYGLPYIFWGYAIGILLILSLLLLAIYTPLTKLAEYDSGLDKLIFSAVIGLFTLTPLLLISFFFYEKYIISSPHHITLLHRLFFLPIRKKVYQKKGSQCFEIKHFLDSPNMARLSGQRELRGFQNKGHFELYMRDSNGELIFLDRNSRKADLEKMIELLALN